MPGSETILIAEDDDSVRELIRVFLAERGYRVIEARGPEEAVALCRAHVEPIHLLVTDLVMPGRGGVALAQEIREVRPGIGVLFLSGYPEETAMRGHAPPAGSAFLQKPFTQEALSRQVRGLLDAGGATPSGG